MQLRKKTVFSLLGILLLSGSMVLSGCSSDDDDENTVDAAASNVANRGFTFASGAVFSPALVNTPTTLSFIGANAVVFTISSTQGRASGSNSFSSCNLIVQASSYPAAQFPELQPNRTIRLDPCEVNTDDNSLLITNTATNTSAFSGPSVPPVPVTGSGGS